MNRLHWQKKLVTTWKLREMFDCCLQQSWITVQTPAVPGFDYVKPSEQNYFAMEVTTTAEGSLEAIWSVLAAAVAIQMSQPRMKVHSAAQQA